MIVDGSMDDTTPNRLWEHKNPESTNTHLFKKYVENQLHQTFKDYEDLRKWSVANLNQFWKYVWHFTGIKASRHFLKVRSEVHLFDLS